METFGAPTSSDQKFKTPQEELEYLRKEVTRHEEALRQEGKKPEREKVIGEKIKEYKALPSERVLHPQARIDLHQTEAIVLELSPEEHDTKIEELLGILQEKGIKNTLDIIQKLKNPHLEDDFHRFLVEYIKKGFPVAGLKEKSPLAQALGMTLYEIILPDTPKGDHPKTLKELVSSMEQFYSGMLSITDYKNKNQSYMTIELANANHSHEFIFYASIPNGKQDLFEKQILSIFPNAKIVEKKDDYNIFGEGGHVAGAHGAFLKNPIFSLKTYEQFDLDPLNVLLNSFSKIARDGEGAALQIVLSPAGDFYVKRYKNALDKILKGTKLKEAIDIPITFFDHFGKAVKDFMSTGDEKKKESEKSPVVDEIAVENIKNKIASQILNVNIRILASSSTEGKAEAILSDIESSFNQFENTNGNKLSFNRAQKGGLRDLMREFSFRMFSEKHAIPLSVKELTTIMHLPTSAVQNAPQLKQAKAGSAPAPQGLPQTGTYLGINRDRAMQTKVYITNEDRMRHMYAIGQTGTGKTTLLKNMILQDIEAGHGVCFIDPHGSDVEQILANIPKARYEDVIYFDPGSVERPLALNMLEYDTRFPEQKTFVVNEMLSIFNKLFDMKTAGGPMFEQYFRNAVMLVLEDPETGNTLLDVARVLAQKSYRELKLSHCKNPIVIQFWKEVAEKAGGEASLANIVPYITSKFDVFLSNEIMRPIVAQEKSSLNFREIMDGKKILLVNLAKGRLGDINSHLLGLIIVGKILMSALSRVDSFGKSMNDFYLYIDEFQNVTTDSIATILSEARKYRLGLTVAHQFIGQLDEKIKNAVFGNVGSLAVFRVGSEDAEFLVKQFEPVFTAQDLMNIDNLNVYLKLLVEGRPVKPFNVEITWPSKGKSEIASELKKLSSLKYGRNRSEVEAEILLKYEKKAL